jgi:ABC-2 type transport system ATP-binding protein
MPSAIRTDGLTKYYGPVIGIEGLSLEVAQGEVYGFLGANGAGKTTTIRLLLDLLHPTRGRASVLGIDCQRDGLAARRQIGYLPGDLPIYPDLNAHDYLAFLGRLDGRRVAPAYLQELFVRFDVSQIDLRRRLRVQSHGMKQKIGIIQALMSRPPVVILDEPTAGLDPLMVQAFKQTILELKRGGDTTVFLSSHVLAEVESTCDRIGIVRGGRLVKSAAIDELKRDAPRRVVVTFSSDVGAPSALPSTLVHAATAREWILETRGPLGDLARTVGRMPVADIQIEAFKLEDYIAQFYDGEAR